MKYWLHSLSTVLLLASLFSQYGCKGLNCEAVSWFQDADGDGLGDPAVELFDCAQPAGFVANAEDSDDTDPQYAQVGTALASVPAPRDMVLYEVNLRAFSPGRDIQEVISRLDHIESLGVNVIWLMPIHPTGQTNSVNSPYSIADFYSVSEEYGSMEDLRQLTDAAHSRGIAVILDWVANHTSWDHPWIEDHPDWYTQNASGEIVHPAGTNWLDVADLNFASEEMRKAMVNAMEYWIRQANVDGFRCDAADFVPFDFWRDAVEELRALPDRELVMLAEGGRADHFTAGFDLNFGWSFYSSLKEVIDGSPATDLVAAHLAAYAPVPGSKEQLRFSTNHDESAWDATPVALFGGLDASFAAFALGTLTGGAALIYSGQEVGTGGSVPFFSTSTTNWSANPALLERYRNLMAFYNSTSAVRGPDPLDYSNSDVVAYTRSNEEREVLVLVNARSTGSSIVIDSELQGSWESYLGEPYSLSGTLVLDPYEVIILSR